MRRVNPMAKKAFDTMHKDKVSLKEAWAKVKGTSAAKVSKPKAAPKTKKCKC